MIFRGGLQTALAAVPGVSNAGAISHVPFDDSPNWGGPYLRPRRTGRSHGGRSRLPHRDARGSSRKTGVRLLARPFSSLRATDGTGAPVAIVDQLLASRAWPGESPLGRTIIVDPGSSADIRCRRLR